MTLASALSPPTQVTPAQIRRVNRRPSAEVRLLNILFSTLYDSFRHFSTALGSFDTLRHSSTDAVDLRPAGRLILSPMVIKGAQILTDAPQVFVAPLLARQLRGLLSLPMRNMDHLGDSPSDDWHKRTNIGERLRFTVSELAAGHQPVCTRSSQHGRPATKRLDYALTSTVADVVAKPAVF
jgi:hypothetical protein